MTTQIDPTKSYKTKYTKTYLDSVDTGIYTFLTSLGYSNGSETILAGDYLDGVLLAVDTTEPDVIVDANGDPVCFWGLNGCGGTSTPVAIEDANGNVTVLNGNGNIPLATTSNVGYVTSGELVIPGAEVFIKGTTYNLTPTQTIGATATTSTASFAVPSVPYESYVVISGRQILATSYSTGGSTHQIRMTVNLASTGPVLALTVTTRDVVVGGGTYTSDSAEMYVQSRVYVPANTASFNITASGTIQILGLTGTTSASGTSGIFTVQRIPRVAGGIV